MFSVKNASSIFSMNSSICIVWSNLEPDNDKFLNPGILLAVLLLMAADKALVMGATTLSTVNAAIVAGGDDAGEGNVGRVEDQII